MSNIITQSDFTGIFRFQDVRLSDINLEMDACLRNCFWFITQSKTKISIK